MHILKVGLLLARRIAGVFGLTVLLESAACGADANYWTKATSGNWEEPEWSLGVLPDSTQSVAIVNSGWKGVAISPTTPVNFPASLTVNDLTVAGGQNTLLLNFAGTVVPLRALNGLSVEAGGTVMNLSSGLLVENGSLTIAGGQIIQDGGLVQATNVTTYVDGNGTYFLTNGTFKGGVVQLGVDSLGSFNQYGGEAGMDLLNVGKAGSSPVFGSGIYNLYGGNLTVRDTLRIGAFYGTGEFFQFGGTNACAWLKVYSSWSGRVKYQLDGGSLNTDFSMIAANNFTTGTFEQNGGSHSVANTLTLYGGTSHGGPMPSRYFLSDGILSARFVQLDGGGGYVVFAQTNGTTSVGDTLFLNSGMSMYIGNVFLHGGTMACENVLSQAAGDNILQTGGNFIVTNLFSFGGHTTYDYPGFPTYKFNGGTLTASNIELSAEWVIGSSAQTGRVANPGYFKLSGTLQIGDATEQLGCFILASNATISMTGSNGRLSFADSSAENWNEESMLIVSNWTGLPSGGGTEQLKFGTNQFGLTSGQLSRIRFCAGHLADLKTGRILNSGEVVPDEVVRPSILSARQEHSLVLSWPPGWVLQSATNVIGPYANVPGATPLYTNDMTASVLRFFRLRQF